MARAFPNGVDLRNAKGVNFADGTASTDAATWGQVQNFLAGLSWTSAVRAASTGNVTLTAPGASLDGVTLVSGDRILLKDQTTTSQNGIYVWTGSGATLSRSSDMDAPAEFKSATVSVGEGTVNADRSFTQTADNVTIGTTAITFVAFGAGMTYTAGSGLQLSGGAFSILLPSGSGLLADGTGLRIDFSVAVKSYAVTFDGSTASYTVAHGLGKAEVNTPTVYDLTTGIEEYPDVVHSLSTPYSLTLTWASAPGSSKRIVVSA